MTQQLWQQCKPKSLDDFVGQEAAIKALRNFNSGFCLISGEPGCGKTTAALLWAHEKFGHHFPWVVKQNGSLLREGEKQTCIECWIRHCHANDFDPSEVKSRSFFNELTMTVMIIDEAQALQPVRQASKLKAIPMTGNIAVMLVTQAPEEIEDSIISRCVKVRMSPLTAKELPELVKRACEIKGIKYDAEYVRILNRGDVHAPREVLNFVDNLALGQDPALAAVGLIHS